MTREVSEPTIDRYGADVHPAFGMIGANRVSVSPPGAVLFDSDIRHGHTVIVSVRTASRVRDVNRDWLHADITPHRPGRDVGGAVGVVRLIDERGRRGAVHGSTRARSASREPT